MKRPITLLLILLCAAFARIAPAQQAPAKTAPSNQIERSSKREGAITGRIIGPDGQPMAEARVSAYGISARSGSGYSATSDDDGNFKLTGLSPGAYVLSAQAPGYVTAEASTENAVHRIGEDATISLVKGGVITGRVTDEAGEPIVGVSVISHRVRDPEGRTIGSRFGMFGFRLVMTDDRGIYRIYGLLPGVYIVSIGISAEYGLDDAQIRRDAPTYYQSATRDTATEINLRGGEEVSGIDIRHRSERGRIVSGTVSGEIDSLSYSRIMLKGLETGRFEAMGSMSNSRGFAFYGVPDGEYELTAMREARGSETSSSATRRVSVKGVDVSGIELKLAPHGSITGRIVIESSNPSKRCAIKDNPAGNQTSGQIQEQPGRQPVVEEITLRADRDDPNQRMQSARFGWTEKYGRAPDEKGEFALKNLEAGRYRIAANLPADGWHIRAILQSGQPGASSAKPLAGATGASGPAKSPVDISRNGIAIKPGEKSSGVEVIIAEGAATLNGRILPAKDGMKLPSWLRAHLIPAEAASADDVISYAETNVRKDGSFEFKHIAPGKYLLHARQAPETEASDDQTRPVAWDAIERAKLRREAEAAKNEIELKPCQRVNEYVLRWQSK